MRPSILIVSGSNRENSHSRILCEIALEAARSANAEIEVLDLNQHSLPLFRSNDAVLASSPEVQEVRRLATWAQGFVIATPEYHGSLGSALKNWFDWLYEELAGKTAGVLACTGGGGGEMSITAVKTNFQWCHGFTLPFHAAARGIDFQEGVLVNENVHERIRRLTFDLVRYAPALHRLFEEAKALGNHEKAGFSAFHQ